MNSVEIANDRWLEIFKDFLRAVDDQNFPAALKRLDAAAEFADKNGLYLLFVESLIAKADLLHDMDRLDEAEEIAKRAMSLSLEHWDTERVTHAHALCSFARIYVARDQVDFATTVYEDAIRIFRRNRAACTQDVVTHFFALLVCYLTQNRIEEADKLSRYVIELTRELIGERDYAVVWALTFSAETATLLGKKRRADALEAEIFFLLNEFELDDQISMYDAVHAALQTSGLPEYMLENTPSPTKLEHTKKQSAQANNVIDIRTGKPLPAAKTSKRKPGKPRATSKSEITDDTI